ncbi:MAG: hypothetical protein M1114_04620 [Candidatus Dependentiae bacterium]|nr:hypothetical protein [Candidatus Dependentiae bacterium]
MNISNSLRILFFSIMSCLCIVTSYSASAPTNPIPQMDLSSLSPEEREMMEMINAMSPDQQQQFMVEIMNELEKEVAKMPADQQEKFLADFWAEVEKEAQQLEEKIKPVTPEPEMAPVIMAPTPAAPAKETKPAPKPAAKSKIDEAVMVIDSLIVKLEKIMSKTALIPDLSVKVNNWLKQNEITPAFANWQVLKDQLELFIQKLLKIKDRDPKTHDYKYMGELVKNEVIVNNLSRVESVLRSTEPSIEIPEFGSTNLSNQSTAALKKVLSTISEAFYRLGLPASLDSIIEKYEPIAKKLSEEKTKSIQEAQQRTSQPRPYTPVMAAGTTPPVPTYQPGQVKYPSAAAPSFDYAANQRPGAYYGESRGTAEPRKGAPATTPAPQPSAGAKAPSAAAKPALPQMPKAPTPVKEEAKDKKEEKKKVEEDKRMEKSLDTLGSAVDNLNATLIDGGFKNIQTQVLSTTPLNVQVANALQPSFNRAQSAVDKAKVVSMRFNKLDKEQKKYYKVDVDIIVSQSNVLNSVIQQIEDIKQQENNVSPDKKWAFFGGKQAPVNATLINLVTPPSPSYTLYTLQEQLIELMKVIKAIK